MKLRIKKGDFYVVGSLILVLGIVFFSLLPILDDVTLSYDGARHASGGYVMHDYIKTILNDGFVSFSDFIDSYSKFGYNVGWFINADPPFGPFLWALSFLTFDNAIFAARFIPLLSYILLAFLAFFVTKKIIKNNMVSFAVALAILASNIFFSFGISSYLVVPIALFATLWYYVTFLTSKKTFIIRVSNKWRFNLQLNYIFGGILLTFVTLLKYQALIYVNLFFVLYLFYQLIRIAIISQDKSKILPNIVHNTEIRQIILIALIQNLIFLIIALPWIKFNLIDQGFLSYFLRVASKDSDVGGDWLGIMFLQKGTFLFRILYYLIGLFFRTGGLILFLPALLYFIFKKKLPSSFDKAGIIQILIFALAVYIFFTFGMGNKQVRYAVHPIPLLIILSVAGLYLLTKFCSKKYSKLGFVFILICSLLFSIHINSRSRNSYYSYGSDNGELLDYLEEKDFPRLLLHIRGAENKSIFYYNPDIIMFDFMLAKKEYNPSRFRQFGHLVEFMGRMESLKSQGSELLDQLEEMPIDKYIIVAKYLTKNDYEQEMFNLIQSYNYSIATLDYWIVFSKLAN